MRIQNNYSVSPCFKAMTFTEEAKEHIHKADKDVQLAINKRQEELENTIHWDLEIGHEEGMLTTKFKQRAGEIDLQPIGKPKYLDGKNVCIEASYFKQGMNAPEKKEMVLKLASYKDARTVYEQLHNIHDYKHEGFHYTQRTIESATKVTKALESAKAYCWKK